MPATRKAEFSHMLSHTSWTKTWQGAGDWNYSCPLRWKVLGFSTCWTHLYLTIKILTREQWSWLSSCSFSQLCKTFFIFQPASTAAKNFLCNSLLAYKCIRSIQSTAVTTARSSKSVESHPHENILPWQGSNEQKHFDYGKMSGEQQRARAALERCSFWVLSELPPRGYAAV